MPAIWLQEMQMFQNKIGFFHYWLSQNYNWGHPTIHMKTKGEKQKKKKCLHVRETSLGLYLSHHLFVDAQLLQISPQATWYRGTFGPERWSLSLMWQPGFGQGHESYFPNYLDRICESKANVLPVRGKKQTEHPTYYTDALSTGLARTTEGNRSDELVDSIPQMHLLGWSVEGTKQ